jgi:hypothetical protein
VILHMPHQQTPKHQSYRFDRCLSRLNFFVYVYTFSS